MPGSLAPLTTRACLTRRSLLRTNCRRLTHPQLRRAPAEALASSALPALHVTALVQHHSTWTKTPECIRRSRGLDKNQAGSPPLLASAAGCLALWPLRLACLPGCLGGRPLAACLLFACCLTACLTRLAGCVLLIPAPPWLECGFFFSHHKKHHSKHRLDNSVNIPARKANTCNQIQENKKHKNEKIHSHLEKNKTPNP